MGNELRRDPFSFLFVICDCGAVSLSRKQFNKNLSAFIQFSGKYACGDYAPSSAIVFVYLLLVDARARVKCYRPFAIHISHGRFSHLLRVRTREAAAHWQHLDFCCVVGCDIPAAPSSVESYVERTATRKRTESSCPVHEEDIFKWIQAAAVRCTERSGRAVVDTEHGFKIKTVNMAKGKKSDEAQNDKGRWRQRTMEAVPECE